MSGIAGVRVCSVWESQHRQAVASVVQMWWWRAAARPPLEGVHERPASSFVEPVEEGRGHEAWCMMKVCKVLHTRAAAGTLGENGDVAHSLMGGGGGHEKG